MNCLKSFCPSQKLSGSLLPRINRFFHLCLSQPNIAQIWMKNTISWLEGKLCPKTWGHRSPHLNSIFEVNKFEIDFEYQLHTLLSKETFSQVHRIAKLHISAVNWAQNSPMNIKTTFVYKIQLFTTEHRKLRVLLILFLVFPYFPPQNKRLKNKIVWKKKWRKKYCNYFSNKSHKLQ